ncbi:50S ribosomal protein L23 [Paracoccaceae bacterium]|jgi:large subunit ribosomal protein L23|nr:50S ribosomal protein L23 [Paracoccaceae bacterium]MDA9122242.1 50S ribosomal protein L23 [Paracoccaceae bacterium]MDC1254839.1 50S ribosomal protein L23 [Paracoccaceae bacterium]MDE2693024.1 50S ribosomal protein L23 [Paracoccaceae bacterium]|tara:strand:+ start:289 stop:585 length:297 start_codon:yes stop_codon:yes gene_type:complete
MTSKSEYYDVIRKPIVTEKATMASESGAVVFEVAMASNKPMIKEAVEALFNVKVKAVNTTITKGKTKRFKGTLGRRKNTKKAYVMLEDGNTIDVSTGL